MLLCVALGSLASTGCLIAEAPSYDAPRRTVPVIDSIDPPPSFQVVIDPDQPTQRFRMRVRSEDAGEQLYASFHIDYDMGSPRELVMGGPIIVPARAADEPKPLTFDFNWDIRVQKGCRTLTLLVMHASTYDLQTDLPRSPVSDDVAAVTWWMDVKTNEPGMALPCPTTPEGP